MKEVILGRAEKQAWACWHWEIERWGLNDGDFISAGNLLSPPLK